MKTVIFYSLLFAVTFFVNSCTKSGDNPGSSSGSGSGQNIAVDCSSPISSNTIWKAGVYTIDCQLNIGDNAVLTIQPGATIKFTGNGGITTTNGGAINASGTSASPIVFTGLQETAGYWYGIDIYSNSTSNIFKYCQFKYGGEGSRSMVRVGDVEYSYTGRASFQNCIFSNGLTNGLYLASNSFMDASTNNKFTANAKYPVSTALESLSQLTSSNIFTGNGSDYIYVNSDYQCYADVHFQNIGVPYYLTASSNNLFDIYGKWTVDPGTVLAMGSNMELEVTNSSGTVGSFNCVGTASNPITIEGFQSTKGFWDKIRFDGSTSTNNQIKYTNIHDGGSYADYVWDDKGMITAINTVYGGNKLIIQNCAITNSLNYGIYISSSSLQNINEQTGTSITNALLTAGNTINNCTSGTIYVK